MKDELTHIFEDAAWKSYRLGTIPNRIYVNAGKRLAAVVVERGQRNDFPLSKPALVRVLEAETKREKIDRAFVVLRERGGGAFCGVEEARTVNRNLVDTPTIDGPYGQYYWINETFGDPKRLDEVPI